jgi:hypothetical protein
MLLSFFLLLFPLPLLSPSPTGFDLRQASKPTVVLEGHSYGVRRVKCSPHNAAIVASCAYDFTVR